MATFKKEYPNAEDKTTFQFRTPSEGGIDL